MNSWPLVVRTKKGRRGKQFEEVQDTGAEFRGRTRLARLEQKERQKIEKLKQRGRRRAQMRRQQKNAGSKNPLGYFSVGQHLARESGAGRGGGGGGFGVRSQEDNKNGWEGDRTMCMHVCMCMCVL